MTLKRSIAFSHFIIFCLLFGAMTVPVIESTAAAASTIIKALRAKRIPVIDGLVNDGEWKDTSAIKEPVTNATIAFKHDGENLYVLATYGASTRTSSDYFGIEFDLNSDMNHMGSEGNPDYGILVSPSLGETMVREVMLLGPVQPVFLNQSGTSGKIVARMVYSQGKYTIELVRAFQMSEDRIRFQVGQTIGVGFAVGQFGSGTAHHATDMASYSLTIVPEAYSGETVVTSTAGIYGFASAYGPYLQYVAAIIIATTLVVTFHVARRKSRPQS